VVREVMILKCVNS